MANPVVVEWMVTGIANVQRGARTVADAVVAAERNASRASQREAAQRVRIADQEAREKVRAMSRADREIQRIKDGASRTAERAMQNEVRAFERAEQEKNRIAMQWVRKREQDEAKSSATRQRFASAIAGSAVQGVRTSGTRIAALASGTAGMVSGLAGGFSVADSVQRSVALKGKLADIANRDVDPSDPNKKDRKSTASVEAKVRGVSAEFGIDADTGANALDKFASKTGELQKGMDMLRGLGELSRAGAGSMDDLADAAGDIFNADKTQSAESVVNKLRQFAIQGQKGAVEMKDLASQMAKIGAAAGRFEGGADKNLLTMGALAQGARESGGAASAREATTAVASLSNQFYKNARLGKMKALGVDPKTAGGYNRPVEEVLMDLMLGAEKKSRAGGKGLHDFDANMGTAIADAQARKATSPLEAAFKRAGGGAAGVAAARAQLGKFGAGGRDLKAEFAEKARSRTGEADAQMEIIKQKFDEAVSTKIIPALLKLVPEFEKLVPLLVDLNAKAVPAFVDLLKSIGEFADANKGIISSIAAHPFAAIIGASLAKSLGSEIISKMAGNAISRLLGSMGGGGGGIPGGGAGGGIGMAVGAGAVAGTAVAAVITKAGTNYADGDMKADDVAAKVDAWKRGDRERGISPEAAMKAVSEAQARIEKTGTFGQVGNLLGSVVSDDASKDYDKVQADKGFVDNKNLITALQEATAAIKAGGLAGSPGAPKTQPITARATQ